MLLSSAARMDTIKTKAVFLALILCISFFVQADQDNITELYNKSCGICHTSGAAGAPRKGNEAQWQPLLAQGMPALVASVEKGKGAMPANGMCASCSKQDFEALIDYMAGTSPESDNASAEQDVTEKKNSSPPSEPIRTNTQTSDVTIDKASQVRAGQAKSASCAACHGSDGNSPSPAFPKLAGQNERYLIKQMQDIQCAALPLEEQKQTRCTPRSIPTMAGQLDNMNDRDLADIAAYYSSQAATIGHADPKLVSLGQAIYRGGIREKQVPACIACHSPSGQGNTLAGFPALAGQYAQYTADQLKAFRAAADGDPTGRANDGDTQVMRMIAYRLSDREIEAVSTYIQGLY